MKAAINAAAELLPVFNQDMVVSTMKVDHVVFFIAVRTKNCLSKWHTKPKCWKFVSSLFVVLNCEYYHLCSQYSALFSPSLVRLLQNYRTPEVRLNFTMRCCAKQDALSFLEQSSPQAVKSSSSAEIASFKCLIHTHKRLALEFLY